MGNGRRVGGGGGLNEFTTNKPFLPSPSPCLHLHSLVLSCKGPEELKEEGRRATTRTGTWVQEGQSREGCEERWGYSSQSRRRVFSCQALLREIIM